jgi:single-stranded-DNA-specific exonuclease
VNEDRRSFLGVEKSLGQRRWLERLGVRQAQAAVAMSQRYELPEIVARILAGRDVEPEEAEGFLAPSVRTLMPDPSVMTDMGIAAERIAAAITGGERVAIYGDYDVDGAASSALLFRFLKHQGLDAQIYIPDRLFEGYGPNAEAVAKLAAGGVELIVAVDCGSGSFEALAEAKRLGVDVVVLDHHETGEKLPPAVAIVNPNRQDDLSGLGALAAVGVTFMTVVAINRVLRGRGWYAKARPEPDLLGWIDLAALGTVCDVVPLRGLNRALVVKGLLVLAQRANHGLAALADISRLGGRVSAYHLGFVLGPRINAGGRIGDAGLGARLLVSDDPAECERIAAELDRLNKERQVMEATMLDEAVAEAEAEMSGGDGPAVLVTVHGKWHPGIVGLVASRLKDRFARPAIAIAMQANGVGTGSARSVPGFDIGHVIRSATEKGLLVKGGGHPMAAGLTIAADRVGDLRAFLEDSAEGATLQQSAELQIDAAVTARGATADLIDGFEKAGPFGAGHPEPVFALPNHRLSYVEEMKNGHLRATFNASDGASIKAIAFRAAGTPMGEAMLRGRGEAFHVAGNLTVDRFRGRATPNLRIIDMAIPNRS